MASVLDAEKPALVVLTGDIITSVPIRQAWQSAIKPVVERNIPWAAVLGNHDEEHGLSRRQIIAILETMPCSMTRSGPKDIGGCGNYTIEVKASGTNKNAAILYFLDSNAYVEGSDNKLYDWIKFEQIEWYRQNSRRYSRDNGGKPLPSLMFFHIPLPEYKYAWNIENTKCIGAKFESVCCPPVNSGLFASIVELKDVIGTFVGHDHSNDYAAYFHGVCLTYGRATGYDTYGQLSRGARVIELKEGKREFDSWIRTEDNSVVRKIRYPSSFVHEQN